MTRIAVAEKREGKTTGWMEKLSDSQCREGPKHDQE
jgi:hypothetical protein